MELREVFILSCFVFLGFGAAGSDGAENVKNMKKRIAFMKMPGSKGYIPILVHDLEGGETVTSYDYKPPKQGYVYPKPSRTTPLPPLAEFTPDKDLEHELDEYPEGVRPDKEAKLPTKPPAIGLETELDIQSEGITPDRFPDGVRDTPGFELNPDGKPCTSSTNCVYGDTIPGTEGIDYPIYGSVPKTDFKCPSLSGYYGDVKARCQAFHVCLNMRGKVRQYSFLCPNGTIFSQMDFVCVWWHDFNCETTPALYQLNKQLRWDDATLTLAQKMENLKRMAKMTDETRPNSMNFPQQLLPALSIRLPSTKQSFGLLQSAQSLQVSKVGHSKTKTQATVYSSGSEAYEDKENASGFIVNRGPVGRTTTTTTTQIPEVFDDPDTPTTVVLTSDEEDRNIDPVGPYLPPRSPKLNYLPPKVRTTTPAYVPPRPRISTTTPVPVAAYLPPADTPDENESNELGNVRAVIDYVTTTNPPITRKPFVPTTPKPNYLPPKPKSGGYSDSLGFDDPAFSMLLRPSKTSDGFPKGYSTPILRDQEKSFSAKQGQVVENQFDGIAFFVPTQTFKGQGSGGVTNLQKDLLQNGLIPIDGPIEPIRAVSYSFPPAPNQPQSQARSFNEGQNKPKKRQFSPEQLHAYNDAQAFPLFQPQQPYAQPLYQPQEPLRPEYQPQFYQQDSNVNQPEGQPRQGYQDDPEQPTPTPAQYPQYDEQEVQTTFPQPQPTQPEPRPSPQPQPQQKKPAVRPPSVTTYQSQPARQKQATPPFQTQVRQRQPQPQTFQAQKGPSPQGMSLASLLGPLLSATVESPVKSVEPLEPSTPLLQTTPRPRPPPPRTTPPPSRPPPARPEPIRTVNFIDDRPEPGIDLSAEQLLGTPEPLPSRELKINLNTPAPTPTHIPESYQRFQEPEFDERDGRRQVMATFPMQLKDLLLPDVSDPPEIVKSDNIFSQTYISQEGVPVKTLGSSVPTQEFMMPYASMASPTYTPEAYPTYSPQPSRPYVPAPHHHTKSYKKPHLPLRFVKSHHRHPVYRPRRPIFQRRPPSPPRTRNKQKSISFTYSSSNTRGGGFFG